MALKVLNLIRLLNIAASSHWRRPCGREVRAVEFHGGAEGSGRERLSDGKEWNNGYQTQRLATVWNSYFFRGERNVTGVSSGHLLSSDFRSPTVKIGTGSVIQSPPALNGSARAQAGGEVSAP